MNKKEIKVPHITFNSNFKQSIEPKPRIIYISKQNKFVEISNMKNTRLINTNRSMNRSPNPYNVN